MKKIFRIACLIACTLFLSSLNGPAMAQTTPLPVVVSIAPQKYILERIAGELLEVTVLVKPGADPHSYEPTPEQMRDCASARLYFSIGVPFEDVWLPRIAGTNKELQVISTIRDIRRTAFADEKRDHEHEQHGGHEHEQHDDHEHEQHGGHEHEQHDDHEHEQHGGHGHGHGHDHQQGEDPHVWLSPLLVAKMLPVMEEALATAMPEHAAQFRANAEAFALELRKLHDDLTAMFAPVPEEKRVFLTFHPAWGYFANDFGLTELTIEINGKEPGPRAMRQVIDTARGYHLNTVFIEPQFPTAAANSIAENITAKVERIDPLAEDIPNNLRQVAKALVDSFPH